MGREGGRNEAGERREGEERSERKEKETTGREAEKEENTKKLFFIFLWLANPQQVFLLTRDTHYNCTLMILQVRLDWVFIVIIPGCHFGPLCVHNNRPYILVGAANKIGKQAKENKTGVSRWRIKNKA